MAPDPVSAAAWQSGGNNKRARQSRSKNKNKNKPKNKKKRARERQEEEEERGCEGDEDIPRDNLNDRGETATQQQSRVIRDVLNQGGSDVGDPGADEAEVRVGDEEGFDQAVNDPGRWSSEF